MDQGAAWLERQSLAAGIKIDQPDGPDRLHLTDPGVRCAAEFRSDTTLYVQAKEQGQGQSRGPTVNIGTNSGAFQAAGDHARQTQNLGASADQLRAMITSIAELVACLVPDAENVAAERDAALAAARDGAVDRPRLQRFADWALSVVNKGAAASLVPAVSAATTELMLEARRLTGHL